MAFELLKDLDHDAIKLDEVFIHDFWQYFTIGEILKHYTFNETFLETIVTDNASVISKYQVLSEKFMSTHSDKLDWDALSRYQEMSEDFILEHKNHVCW